ncbi:MAG: ABC transporter permease [Tistlia sp.]|uniref:ABC transporter permease n=1 Tax=Tistlia sp. TaxID=3057121 RepID=UPI0034A3F4BD
MEAHSRRTLSERLATPLFLGWQIFVRDFRARYRRAMLSLIWVLAPMVMIAGTAYVVARELDLEMLDKGVPYPVTLIAGLLLWGVFSEAVSGPQQMCRRSRTFLRKAPIDYGAILVGATGYVVLNFLIKLPILIGVMVWFGIVPTLEALLVLPLLVALWLLGLSLGALVAPLSLVYFDVRYGLPFVLILLLVLTPVLYPPPEAGLLQVITQYNPLAHLIVAARDLLLTGNSTFELAAFTSAAGVLLLLAPLALLYYYRGMPKGVVHI